MNQNITYRFRASSKVSFIVTHHGRRAYINFDHLYQGISRFSTTDAALAEKVRAHRWFKCGLIVEDPPVSDEAVEAVEDNAPTEQVEAAEAEPNEVPTEQAEAVEAVEVQQELTKEAATTELTAEDVYSLSDAKHYLREVCGATAAQVANRNLVTDYCSERGITFPHFEL